MARVSEVTLRVDGVELSLGDRILITNQGARGASHATLQRRARYGGRKGKRATVRLRTYRLNGAYVVTSTTWPAKQPI